MNELWDDYLEYLIWRGNLERFKKLGHLFEILHNIEFRYIIERDGNRDADGMNLRDGYNIPDGYSNKQIEEFMDRRTSVLEVLIALAIRVDDDYIGDPGEEHPEEFFLEMLENLGLWAFKGKRYKEEDVRRIIDRWLDRDFTRKGVGSPFPLHYCERDQRDLEIWDQMKAYVNENYG